MAEPCDLLITFRFCRREHGFRVPPVEFVCPVRQQIADLPAAIGQSDQFAGKQDQIGDRGEIFPFVRGFLPHMVQIERAVGECNAAMPFQQGLEAGVGVCVVIVPDPVVLAFGIVQPSALSIGSKQKRSVFRLKRFIHIHGAEHGTAGDQLHHRQHVAAVQIIAEQGLTIQFCNVCFRVIHGCCFSFTCKYFLLYKKI